MSDSTCSISAWSPGRAWVDLVGTLIVVPWAAIVLWFGWQTTLRSVAVFEKFPETWSPGYWVFKVLLIVFAGLLLLQAAGHIARDIAQLLITRGPAPEPGAMTWLVPALGCSCSRRCSRCCRSGSLLVSL